MSFEADIYETTRKHEAKTADGAQSSAEVRLTTVLVLAGNLVRH